MISRQPQSGRTKIIVIVCVLITICILCLLFRFKKQTGKDPETETETEDMDSDSETEDMDSDSDSETSIPKPTTVAVKNANGIPKPKIAKIPKKPKLESPPPTPSPSKTLPPPPPKGQQQQQQQKPIPSQRYVKDGKFVQISLDDLTDEKYEEFDSFYTSYNKDNYPNRFKRQELRMKIDMVKKKGIYAYLPGHSKSHNMNVISGDPMFWEWQQDETQKVTEEDAKKWLDTEYTKRNRDGISTFFPYHTLTSSEILKLAKVRLERIGINTSTRNKYALYGFDDRTGECHKNQPCDYDGYTGMKPEIADFYKPCYDTDKYSSDKERERCLYD